MTDIHPVTVSGSSYEGHRVVDVPVYISGNLTQGTYVSQVHGSVTLEGNLAGGSLENVSGETLLKGDAVTGTLRGVSGAITVQGDLKQNATLDTIRSAITIHGNVYGTIRAVQSDIIIHGHICEGARIDTLGEIKLGGENLAGAYRQWQQESGGIRAKNITATTGEPSAATACAPSAASSRQR